MEQMMIGIPISSSPTTSRRLISQRTKEGLAARRQAAGEALPLAAGGVRLAVGRSDRS